MFDTIAAYCQIDLDKSLFQDKSVWKTKYNNKNSKYGKKIEYYTCIDGIRVNYIFPSRLRVEFSIPMFLFRTNTIMYSENDYSLLISSFMQKLTSLVQFPVPSFADWTVTRLDCCYNFQAYSEKDKQIYLDIFKKVNLNRYKFIEKYKTSYYSYNHSAVVNIYDKSKQLLNTGKKIIESDKFILRFEVQMKNNKIRSKYKENRRVCELLKPKISKSTLEAYMNKLFINNNIMSMQNLFDEIDKQFSSCKSQNLREFILLVNEQGLSAAKLKISSSTYYSHINQLKSHNLNPIFLAQPVEKPINWDIIF
jgi:hypothetical protein